MSKCIFHIRNSRITNPKVIRGMFDQLKDGRYTLDIVSETKRSGQQNKYFHGIVVPLVFQGLREAGYDDVKDVHDAKDVIKSLFLKKKIVNQETGEVITEIIKNTSELTTEEFMIFIDEVVRWASEFLSISIPAPNTQATIEY